MAGTMQRTFLSGLVWVLVLNLIVKPFWIFGIEVGVQNAVGAESYGMYFSLFNLALIFNILLDVGITNYNTRNMARHPQLMRKHMSAILSVKIALLAFYMVVTLTVGVLMGLSSREFWLLAVLSFNQFLSSLLLYLRSNFEGLMLFRWDSVLSVMDRVLMIAICGCLLLYTAHSTTEFRIEWFVYAQTAAYTVSVAIALLLLMRRTGLRRMQWNRLLSIAIVRQSAPYALLVLIMACYNRIDPLLLRQLCGDGNTAAGVYASAFRLLDALTMIAYLVSVPLLPVYARLSQRSLTDKASHEEMRGVTGSALSLLMVFAVTMSIALSGVAVELMELLYTDHAAESASVFAVVIYCIVPISMTYIFGTLLTAAGELRWLNWMAIVTLMVNVALNMVLIPRYGAVGSAWASLTAQTVMAVGQMVVAWRKYRPMPSWGFGVRLIALIVVLICGTVALPQIGWLWRFAAVVGVGVVAALSLGLIDIRQFVRLLRERG